MITFLPDHLELLKRIKAGGKDLDFELFVSQHNLQMIKGAAAVNRAKSFKNLNEAQAKQRDLILLDEDVLAKIQRVVKDQSKLGEVMTSLVALLEKGTLPSDLVVLDFWGILAYGAEKNQDAGLLSRCAAGLRAGFPDRKDVTDWADKLDKKVAGMGK